MKRLAEDTQLYQLIQVDGDNLRFEARTAVGEPYDAFDLKKQPGQINLLEEIPAQVKERLRPAETLEASAVQAVGTAD